MRAGAGLGRVTDIAASTLAVLAVAPWAGSLAGIASAWRATKPSAAAVAVCSGNHARSAALRCPSLVAGMPRSSHVGRPCQDRRPICLHGTFTIGGNTSRPFYPGTSEALDLRISNPFKFPIKVIKVSVSVEPVPTKDGKPDPACPGMANLLVTKHLGTVVTVPARSTNLLSELEVPQQDWPQLTMPDLPVNQDACEGAVFTLDYWGTATRCATSAPKSRLSGPTVA